MMTRRFYEAKWREPSEASFVHYPCETYPNDEGFIDNTHFNPYGAYEIAK